jgi:cell fate (sporulation/competence/biofilm development) regulator YmcA (YheA/YmcA/DUF963 family)
MTKKEMDELVDVIVGKLMEKQKQLDKEFIKDLEASNVPIEVHERVSEKDKMIMEITKLRIMIDAYEKTEEYEKASACSERIEYLKSRISEL